MPVTTTTSTNSVYVAYTGTLAEVINALDENGINNIRNVIVYYNGTNITAVAEKRGS